MKFDSNRAWMEAVAAIKVNRDLLLTIGAFFFFLPTLVSLVLTADLQTRLSESMASVPALEQFISANGAPLVAASALEFAVNAFGMLTLLLLLSDRQRPTVGQALLRASQGLPGLIGLVAIFLLIFLVSMIVISITLGTLLILVFGQTLGAMITALAVLVVGGLYPAARLSLAVPALVLGGMFNPLRAAFWAWRTTRGNGVALAVFYSLLTLAFTLVGLAAMLMIGPIVLAAFGQGAAFYLFAGTLNGFLSIVQWVILTAVLSRCYRQFAEDEAGG